MTINVDRQVLQQATILLLRHDLALGEARVPVPDTGSSTSLTTTGLDNLEARVRSVETGLHGLADGLDAFVHSVLVADGTVGEVLDTLLAGGLR